MIVALRQRVLFNHTLSHGIDSLLRASLGLFRRQEHRVDRNGCLIRCLLEWIVLASLHKLRECLQILLALS